MSVPIRLDELEAPVRSKVVVETVDVADNQQRLKVKGVFQAVDLVNENNRRYGESVWTKNLAEDSPFKRRLQEKAVLGELEHPDSGMTHLGRVSHLVQDVWMEDLRDGNPYEVKPGKWVIGEALIFNTPMGMILGELHTCGVPVGVSSRGRGDVESGADGVDEVSENYEVDTFDFVASPSVVKAYPIPVKADGTLKTQKALACAIKESQDLCKQASGDLSNLVLAVELGASMGNLYERMKKSPTSWLTEQRQGALSDLKKSVATVVGQIQKKTSTERILLRKAEKPRRKDTAVANKQMEHALQIIGELTDRLVKAEKAAAAITNGEGGSANGEGNRTLEVLHRRYDRLVKGADILLRRARHFRREAQEAIKTKKDLETVETKYETAVRIGEKLRLRLITAEAKLADDDPKRTLKKSTKTEGKRPEKKTPRRKPPINETRRRPVTKTRRSVTERTAVAVKVHDPAGSRSGSKVQESTEPRSLMAAVAERCTEAKNDVIEE